MYYADIARRIYARNWLKRRHWMKVVIDIPEQMYLDAKKSGGDILVSVMKKGTPLEPQPKTGHWIDDCGGVKCSCCGYCIDDDYYAKTYCPNCGCRMESEVTP
jgi:hypothetical protein